MKKILVSSFALLLPGEKRKMALLSALDILVSVADIASLGWLVWLVHLYTQLPGKGALPYLPASLQDPHSLWPAGVFLLLYSFKNLAGFQLYRAQCQHLTGIASRLARKRLQFYLEGSYLEYVQSQSAACIRQISYEPLDFCQHVLGGLQQMLTQVVLILLSVTAILLYHPSSFLVLLLMLLPPVVIVFYLLKKKLTRLRQEAREHSDRALQYLQEALHGFVESNIYHRNETFLQRYMLQQDAFNQRFVQILIAQGLPSRLMELFALAGLFLLIAVQQWTGHANQALLTTIGLFMAAAYKIIPGIVKVMNLGGQVNAYGYIAGQLKTRPAPAVANPINTPILSSIQFEAVHFDYGAHTVLKDLHWQLQPGDFAGISGPSGKGKTTVLNLLLGFLQPMQGNILVNERITTAQERKQFWPRISYVKQQSFLTQDTIAQNITLHEEDQEEALLNQVMEQTGLAALVKSLPDKEMSILAEAGRNMSGGQKQRIAIARALYKEADLIILDEPFNELDAATEQTMLHHFKDLCSQGKMVVLITHQQKSFAYCNKMLYLHEEA